MKRLIVWCLAAMMALLCLTPAFAAPEEAGYDATLSRVIDEPDWLTDEEEARLEAACRDAIAYYNVDCPVILLEDMEADQIEDLGDFSDVVYEYYGYGVGGNCVLMLIDAASGTINIDTYGTASSITADQLDMLGDDFVARINNGEDLCDALITYVEDAAWCAGSDGGSAGANWEDVPSYQITPPVWYPGDVSAFTDFHNDAATPRVVDNADIFTDDQERRMAEKIAAIQQAYGVDFVVYTDDSDYGLGRGICAADFYQFNGYGFGDDYSGGVLFICMEPGNRGWWTAARGSYRELFTEENCDRIDDRLEPYMVDGSYGEGVLDYLDNTDTLLRTGAVPKERHFGMPALISLLSFGLAGGGSLGVQRSKMKTVRQAERAHSYLEEGSFRLRRRSDFYLHSTVTRTRKEKEKSGGGSSFSGGYSSSGGGSFSGGGRSF